jgi:hypothetical protein
MEIIQSLQNRIYEIRGQRVILDKDIAQLYEVDTKVLNQSVKRNIDRFPEDFMFQLTNEELEKIRVQVRDLDPGQVSLRSQIVTLKTGRGEHAKYLPLAFTEQGVAMLSGHDVQLTQIYEAIENILDENAAKTKWDNRTRIGFK